MRKQSMLLGLIATSAIVIAYAQTATTAPTPVTATADLKDAQGNVVGNAVLTETDTVKLTVTLKAFKAAKPGEHGIHIHAVGNCAPTFAAAGGHFNPDKHQHGLLSSKGRHAGDLPNMVVDAEGNATYEVVTELVTLREGERSLFDQDGSALVIHAGPDDYRSDPAGNSGDRIACGVITLKK